MKKRNNVITVIVAVGLLYGFAYTAADTPPPVAKIKTATATNTIRFTYSAVYEDGTILNAHFMSEPGVTVSRIDPKNVHVFGGSDTPTDPQPPVGGSVMSRATVTAFAKIRSDKKQTWASVYAKLPYKYIADGLTQGVFGNPPDQAKINTALDASFSQVVGSDWLTFRSEVSAAMGPEYLKDQTAANLAKLFGDVSATLQSLSLQSATATTPQIDVMLGYAQTFTSATSAPINADEFAMWIQIIQLLLPLIMALFGL